MNSTNDAPDWTRTAHRIDRPKIDRWWKPEDGIVDGFIVWQGDGSDRQTGETYHAFAIREGTTGVVLGIAERAALRGLRQARPGTRVYIKPTGKRDIGGGREMLEFEVYALEVTATAAAPARATRTPEGGRDGTVGSDGASDNTNAGGNGDGIPF
jgi:hypothetical protein